MERLWSFSRVIKLICSEIKIKIDLTVFQLNVNVAYFEAMNLRRHFNSVNTTAVNSL